MYGEERRVALCVWGVSYIGVSSVLQFLLRGKLLKLLRHHSVGRQQRMCVEGEGGRGRWSGRVRIRVVEDWEGWSDVQLTWRHLQCAGDAAQPRSHLSLQTRQEAHTRENMYMYMYEKKGYVVRGVRCEREEKEFTYHPEWRLSSLNPHPWLWY